MIFLFQDLILFATFLNCAVRLLRDNIAFNVSKKIAGTRKIICHGFCHEIVRIQYFQQIKKHETGFEPATLALARRYSTTEPLVHSIFSMLVYHTIE